MASPPTSRFERVPPDDEANPGDVYFVLFEVDVPSWVPFEEVVEGWVASAKRIERRINAQLNGSITVLDTDIDQSGGVTYLTMKYRADTSPGPAAIAGAISSIGIGSLIGLGLAVGIITVSIAVAYKITQADPGDIAVGAGLGSGVLILGGLIALSSALDDD